ncbi:hypothetical protein LINGRAHAP2_LOCUS33005 [Linum grandiflorum]
MQPPMGGSPFPHLP